MKIFLSLLFICLLGLVLRFYALAQIPNGISGDEAAFGYNAYSILKTGRDEFGIKFPLLFQSFNDHKNPVFVYLLVPFVWIFGLNEWAIRLPCAILGAIVILLFYLLTQQLFKNSKLALAVATLSAISPWLVQYSRIGLETMPALFFSLLGVWLFLRAKQQNKLYLLSSIVFGLAFWTYYASKLWVVGFGAFLIFQEIFVIRKVNKFLIWGLVLFIFISLPYLKLVLDGQILARQYGISVFADKNEELNDAQLLAADWKKGNQFGKIVHNRRLSSFNQLATGFLNILNPSIFFGQVGRGGSSQIPNTRLFYLWQLPLLFFGVLYLANFSKLAYLVFFWLVIGFIPGAVTNLPVFDRRILINSYPMLLLTVLGARKIFSDLKKNSFIQKTSVFIFTFMVLISFSFYCHFYFYHGPTAVVDLWGNGVKELVTQTQQSQTGGEKVIISSGFDRPLIYFLFYEKYPPAKYLQEGGTVGGDYREERNHFANYQFKEIKKEELNIKDLYVWPARESSKGLTAKKTIYQTDGQPFAYIGIYEPVKE